MECPRCGHQQAEAAIECVACGVILAKARPMAPGSVAPRSSMRRAGEQDLPLTARLVRLVLDDPRTDPVLLGVRIVLLCC